MQLFWHRRDLRARDNHGLAAIDGPVLPVFVLDGDVLDHAAPPRVAVLLDALGALRDRYRSLGGDLRVVEGDPARELPRLAREHDADGVAWNEDYSGLARERDDRVVATLDDAGVPHDSFDDALLHEPGSITTNAGDHYSVFSYFWEKWREGGKDDPYPAPEDVASVEVDPIPAPADLGFEPPEADLPPAGPDAARERLDAFRDGPIFEYAADRDYPAREGTARLSPHLKFGTIGVREVWAATADAAEGTTDEGRESVTEFRRQLAWREFYAHALAAEPRIVAQNYREYENPIPWREAPAELAAWKRGETGYPIVDAGMRQLRAEAWMHNRVRMIVASFLTKDLFLDWRAGYAHFREHLVDHDPASDAGGWQWAASTGMDAQPYFRIFNPTTQGERYDPDAEYVHEHVPELRDVPPDEIHRWDELAPERCAELAPEYPAPIVDHAERREEALAAFEAARGG